MKKKALGVIAALALTAPVGIALTTTSADATGTYYSSCDRLHRVWPHGVAKSAAAAQRQVNQGNLRPASGPRARNVYWANYTRLDRDRDGTACETS